MAVKTIVPLKYGITEQKKKELDQLSVQVLEAENDVTQLQAVVNSLSQKTKTYQGFLAAADANRAQALSNKNLVDALILDIHDLRHNSKIAFNEMVLAKEKSEQVAQHVKMVINKLIYTAEVINKLANLIARKKAQNILISDDLVAMITAAGRDANNAVALTLVALRSTFAAQATGQESEAACTLEYTQTMKLYTTLTVDADAKNQNFCLQTLLTEAYVNAQLDYERAQKANDKTLSQYNKKNAELGRAQILLRSLQSGLSAANAAALAS